MIRMVLFSIEIAGIGGETKKKTTKQNTLQALFFFL